MGKVHYDPIENASRDEITALQTERMANCLARAQKVPFYEKAFADAGLAPSDFKELSDIAKFPMTEKDDLRNNYPFGMLAIPRDKALRIHASSGTTGKPTVAFYSKADIDMWAECVARSIYASGGRPGDIIQVTYGYGLFTGGLGAHYGAEKLGCTVIPASGGMTERQALLISDLKPDIIMVTPSYMLNIIDELERIGVGANSSLKAGIFGAEPWTENMRAEIEARGGLDALDIYGLSEVLGPGVANECVEAKDGLVVWEDHFYPEVVDPQTGEVLPEGEFGELVFTTITKEAMPLVRYRTRDMTRILPGTSRSMRRIEKVIGRNDDMLIIRGVNLYPTQVERLILDEKTLAPHYQLHVTRAGNLDNLAVQVERKEGCSENDATEGGKNVAKRMKETIGVAAEVLVKDPGGVERSAGKAKRVVDDR